MQPKNKNKKRSFTYLELIIALAIIAIFTGVVVAMMSPFSHRQQLEISAVTLLGDLRQTQQFARVQRDGYKYYGLRFYSGPVGDPRIGYKIVRYNPPDGVEPIDMLPPVNLNNFTVIKSSVAGDNPELSENTFFGKGVVFDETSELKTSCMPLGYINSIVFTPEGSAAGDLDCDGALETFETLLTNNTDEIKLSTGVYKRTIQITPLTGHVQIQ